MDQVITSHTDEQTQQAGEDLAQHLLPGDVLCLYGDLGAGKTTFTKGIARGLGLTTRILSPTFSLIRMHEIKDNPIKMLNHLDLYRLDTVDDIKKIGVDEIFQDPEGLTIIEWAEKMETHLPEKRVDIRFTIHDSSRTIHIKRLS